MSRLERVNGLTMHPSEMGARHFELLGYLSPAT
jgi:hypothetical protein